MSRFPGRYEVTLLGNRYLGVCGVEVDDSGLLVCVPIGDGPTVLTSSAAVYSMEPAPVVKPKLEPLCMTLDDLANWCDDKPGHAALLLRWLCVSDRRADIPVDGAVNALRELLRTGTLEDLWGGWTDEEVATAAAIQPDIPF